MLWGTLGDSLCPHGTSAQTSSLTGDCWVESVWVLILPVVWSLVPAFCGLSGQPQVFAGPLVYSETVSSLRGTRALLVVRSQINDLGLMVMNCLPSPPHHYLWIMLNVSQPKSLLPPFIRPGEVVIHLLLQHPQEGLEFSFLSFWLWPNFSSIISPFFSPSWFINGRSIFFALGKKL